LGLHEAGMAEDGTQLLAAKCWLKNCKASMLSIASLVIPRARTHPIEVDP
jgi:hypothetical protein